MSLTIFKENCGLAFFGDAGVGEGAGSAFGGVGRDCGSRLPACPIELLAPAIMRAAAANAIAVLLLFRSAVGFIRSTCLAFLQNSRTGYLVKTIPKRSRSIVAYSSSLVRSRSCRWLSAVSMKRNSLRLIRPFGVAREQMRARVKCDCGDV